MSLVRELRSAWRGLRRDGTVALVVVLLLAAAIAATTTIFSIVNAVLLRPLPFADPERVVMLWGANQQRGQPVIEVSLGELREWRARNTTLSSIDVFGSVNWGYRITAPGEPFNATYSSVSGSFFETLGARPMLGRTFRPADDAAGAPGTIVLSANLWRRRFSADPGVVGKTVTIGEGNDARPFEIIGGMGPEFDFPAGAELWAPATRDMAEFTGNSKTAMDGLRVYYALGRLRQGATVEQVRADLSTIVRGSELWRDEAASGSVIVITPLLKHFFGTARPALAGIFGAVTLLLFIACANAAGLLLVRGVAREREIAVRLALGAGRAQLVRQFLCEAALLVIAAGSAGVALAYAIFDVVVALSPSDVPRLDRASIDGTVLLFAIGLAVVTPLVVGALPAWQLSRAEFVESLKHSARTASAAPRAGRVRKMLVVGQLAAALVLLISAGLLARSFLAVMRLDLGFDPRNVLTFDLHIPKTKYPDDQKQRALVAGVLDQIGRVPGVTAAGAIYQRPFAHGPIGMDTGVIVEGQPLSAETANRNPKLNWESATPQYFRAMDIRLMRGRSFTDRDDEQAPLVVLVSERLAARLWPGLDPIGKRLLAYGAPEGKDPVWQTVVGVVEDARYREVQDARYDLYLPYRQAPSPVKHYVVRTVSDPLSTVPAIEQVLKRLDLELTIENPTTMERIVARTIAPWRFSMVVFTVFSLLAVLFAAIGLSAVIAYAVKQRTREIGIRLALGARPGDVVRLLVGEGAHLMIAGLAIGLPAALMVTRVLSSLLFGVTPTDTATFAGLACVLGAVSLLAAYLPARQAAAVDPVAALRRE